MKWPRSSYDGWGLLLYNSGTAGQDGKLIQRPSISPVEIVTATPIQLYSPPSAVLHLDGHVVPYGGAYPHQHPLPALRPIPGLEDGRILHLPDPGLFRQPLDIVGALLSGLLLR